MYKYMNNLLPNALSYYFTSATHIHDHDTRSRSNLFHVHAQHSLLTPLDTKDHNFGVVSMIVLNRSHLRPGLETPSESILSPAIQSSFFTIQQYQLCHELFVFPKSIFFHPS